MVHSLCNYEMLLLRLTPGESLFIIFYFYNKTLHKGDSDNDYNYNYSDYTTTMTTTMMMMTMHAIAETYTVSLYSILFLQHNFT